MELEGEAGCTTGPEFGVKSSNGKFSPYIVLKAQDQLNSGMTASSTHDLTRNPQCSVEDDVWTHLVYVVDFRRKKLLVYVNGALIYSAQ